MRYLGVAAVLMFVTLGGGACEFPPIAPLDGDGGVFDGGLPADASLCGNSQIDTDVKETCDPGTGVDTSACNGKTAGAVSCQVAACGDGYPNLAAGEHCDVGASDTAACNGSSSTPTAAACQLASCGDGHINLAAGESCEPPGGADTADCNVLAVAQNRGKLDRRDHVTAISRSDHRGAPVATARGDTGKVDAGVMAAMRGKRGRQGSVTTSWAWGGAAAFQPVPRDGGSSRLRWR